MFQAIDLNPHQNPVWVLLGRDVDITHATQLDSNTFICSGCFGSFSDTSVGEQLKVSAMLMQSQRQDKTQRPLSSHLGMHCDTIPILEH